MQARQIIETRLSEIEQIRQQLAIAIAEQQQRLAASNEALARATGAAGELRWMLDQLDQAELLPEVCA